MSLLLFSDHLLILYVLLWGNIHQLVASEDIVVQPQTRLIWTSLTFALPVDHLYRIPPLWLNCRRFSLYYCLDAFETEDEDQFPAFTVFYNHSFDYLFYKFSLETGGYQACTLKLHRLYRHHNAYSDEGGCCFRQCTTYFSMGYKKSMQTVDEYFEKLTNYKDENKKLNAIWSYFDPDCRRNYIAKVGFGTGRLKRFSLMRADQTVLDVFPYQMKIGLGWSAVIPAQRLNRFLTFSWFKQNIICKSQPWICNTLN